MDQNTFELRYVLGVIRRWFWLILLCSLLAAAAAYAVFAYLPPNYEASTTLLVELTQDNKTSEYSSIVAAERLALTYTQMLKGRPVLEEVIQKLDLQVTPDELAESITTEPIRDTQLIRLTVQSGSPKKAQVLADTIAEVFKEQVVNQAWDQYASTLVSMQEELDSSKLFIEDTQEQYDALWAKKIEQESDLRLMENQLAEKRSDLRVLEAEFQSLDLMVAHLTDSVKVIDYAQPPEGAVLLPYKSTVMLLVDQAPVTIEGDYSSILASERLASTYAEMLTSASVLNEALALSEVKDTPEALAKKIEAEPIEDTQLILLSVTHSNVPNSILLANTIADVFIEQIHALLAEPYTDRLTTLQDKIDDLSASINVLQAEYEELTSSWVQSQSELARLENQLLDARSDYRALSDEYDQQQAVAADATQVVSIAEPATLPTGPSQPTTLYIVLAAIAGAVIALGVAFLLEYLDDTIKTSDDIRNAIGLETLGTISRHSEPDEGYVVIHQPLSPTAEAYRSLATNIRRISSDFSLRTLMVTSPSSKEGKSFTVANLAVALAKSNQQVVVVDADMRLSSIHKLFSVSKGDGLAASLYDGYADGRLIDTKVDNLSVLTSGEPKENPAELINSALMRKLLNDLAHGIDLVLVDTPPVLPVADAKILASQVDGVLLVVRMGVTKSKLAKEAVRSLQQAGANIIGVLLNATSPREHGYYYYYGDGKAPQNHAKKRNA